MTDRHFNLVVRSNLRAAAEHVRRGHAGRWRHCADPLCRDAQNFVPPLEALQAEAAGRPSLLASAAFARLQALESESPPN
ncbi:MAG TPA: hypothetical protein VGC93_05910 [Thermoanaerobaculia bacterium]